MKRRTRRFSLLELMIVLLILGLLAALAVPNLMKKADKAKYKTGELQVKLLSNAIKDYYLDMDEYPDTLEDLVTDTGDTKWDGPYLDPPKIPLDPWGEPFRYDFPGRHGQFDLSSLGADKSPGGDKYNADINNWE
ncbi:MAG: type II secretion system major pseudopilin GspG [Lentisphaeria bacterium]|nr:type II secretion system major pseudopilin GspG [Lentisphaeria bacterium]